MSTTTLTSTSPYTSPTAFGSKLLFNGQLPLRQASGSLPAQVHLLTHEDVATLKPLLAEAKRCITSTLPTEPSPTWLNRLMACVGCPPKPSIPTRLSGVPNHPGIVHANHEALFVDALGLALNTAANPKGKGIGLVLLTQPEGKHGPWQLSGASAGHLPRATPPGQQQPARTMMSQHALGPNGHEYSSLNYLAVTEPSMAAGQGSALVDAYTRSLPTSIKQVDTVASQHFYGAKTPAFYEGLDFKQYPDMGDEPLVLTAQAKPDTCMTAHSIGGLAYTADRAELQANLDARMQNKGTRYSPEQAPTVDLSQQPIELPLYAVQSTPFAPDHVWDQRNALR
jgi:hypothetical protein